VQEKSALVGMKSLMRKRSLVGSFLHNPLPPPAPWGLEGLRGSGDFLSGWFCWVLRANRFGHLNKSFAGMKEL